MQAFEQLTVSATVLSLDPEKYKNGREKAQKATVAVSTNPIRFRVDGGLPTTTLGIPASAGDVIELKNYNEIQLFRVIKSDVGDAVIDIAYGDDNQ